MEDSRPLRPRRLSPAVIAGGAVLLLLIVGGLWWYISSRPTGMDPEQELFMAEEKGRMETELQELAQNYQEQISQLQGREVQLSLGTDSLILQLEQEKAQIEKLKEELRQTKATDTKRIRALTSEIETLRNLLKEYIAQIDSLHSLNQALTEENTRVREALSAATGRAEELTKQKAELTDVVERAAVLRATGIAVQKLDKRGKKTGKLSKIETLAVTFTIPQNVTAQPGNKEFVLRILSPTDEPLSGGGTFTYEGSTLSATARKTVEYTGEEMQITIYKPVTESLLAGSYRADLFCDGHLIGKQAFSL